jgi:hypothetical protein
MQSGRRLSWDGTHSLSSAGRAPVRFRWMRANETGDEIMRCFLARQLTVQRGAERGQG